MLVSAHQSESYCGNRGERLLCRFPSAAWKWCCLTKPYPCCWETPARYRPEAVGRSAAQRSPGRSVVSGVPARLHSARRDRPGSGRQVNLAPFGQPRLSATGCGQHQEFKRQLRSQPGARFPDRADRGADFPIGQRPMVFPRSQLGEGGIDVLIRRVVRSQPLGNRPFENLPQPALDFLGYGRFSRAIAGRNASTSAG